MHRAPTKRDLKVAVFGLLLFLLLGAYTAYAQNATLDESDFWKLLERTDLLLQPATTPAAEDAAMAQLHQWWDNVQTVRVNSSDVQVDMTWLTQATPDSLAALQKRVQALLDYHRRQSSGSGGASLSALNGVLQDPRFQYPDATPTPLPRINPSLPEVATIDPRLSQTLLIVVGVLSAVVVVAYFARNLRIQRAVVEAQSASDDDPTSSADATRRATEFEASQDYRSAIRYQYLSSLLLLDERGLIHYDRTLTNREHVRQVAAKPQLVSLLQPVVNAFDDVWYGFMPVDEVFYRQYCQNVERLRQIVRR